MRLPRSRVATFRPLLLATAVGMAIGATPAAADAQAGLTHADNAIPVPRGMLRFSAIPSWARYDTRFTGSGLDTEPLGAVLTSGALGTAELPALTRFEGALRALTGDPNFSLSLGSSFAFASMRVVTTPISLEYGVTRRFSLGVMVPIVQRQRELTLDIAAVDAIRHPQAGNVGPSAGRFNAGVYLAAAQLAEDIDAAAAQLEQLIASCAASPDAADCAAVTADPAGAAAVAAEAREVAASVRFVYGTSAADPGVGLTPRAGVSATIATRLQSLNSRLAAFLGGTPLPTQVPPAGAAGPVASGDVRDLARRGVEGIGPDSLGRITDLSIGDVEIGARLLLWDSRPAVADTSRPTSPRARVLLGAVARLATGEPADDNELFAVGAGDGQADAEGMLAVDVDVTPRFGATLLGRYTRQLGEVVASRLPDVQGSLTPFGATRAGTRQLGDVVTLEVSPRYWLATSLFVAGHYGLIARAEDTYEFPPSGVVDPSPLPAVAPLPERATAQGYTEHRAGISLSYSTVAEWERRRVRVPIEVSYTHLETFYGTSAMVPRAGRDQIRLRVYYPLRR